MPAEPQRGMDHDLYGFVPMPLRPTLRWPGGQPLAVWFVLFLEYWELAPPKGTHRAPGVHGMWGNQYPDFRTWTYRLYGERLGAYRILDALKRQGLRVTVAAGAEICRRYPALLERCAADGHEVAAHGTHATRMITSRMSEDEERSHIAEAVDAIDACLGVRPRGWFGQDQGESTRTPRLVAQAGLDYLGDWPNDEQPYWTSTEPPLVSLPVQTELDDLQLQWMRQIPPWRHRELVEEAVRTLAADGADQARSLGLGLRSWLSGRPHRIGHLETLLERLAGDPEVWVATAAEVVDAFRSVRPHPMRRDNDASL